MRKSVKYLLIVAIILAVFYWVYLPGITKYRELKLEEEKILNELSLRDTQISELKAERDRLQNDLDYLQGVIRDELGLVKPGEIVYKFVPHKVKPTQEEITAEPLTGMGIAGAVKESK